MRRKWKRWEPKTKGIMDAVSVGKVGLGEEEMEGKERKVEVGKERKTGKGWKRKDKGKGREGEEGIRVKAFGGGKRRHLEGRKCHEM